MQSNEDEAWKKGLEITGFLSCRTGAFHRSGQTLSDRVQEEVIGQGIQAIMVESDTGGWTGKIEIDTTIARDV
jgi:hypothetical protein